AASPLAFLLLLVVVGGFALADRWRRATVVRVAAVVVAVGSLLTAATAAFASGSWDPFPPGAFIPALACSAGPAGLTWRVGAGPPLHYAALLNAAACVAAFAVSSNVGEGVTRLRYAALPVVILALSLRRWRPVGLSVLAVALAAYWNTAPL